MQWQTKLPLIAILRGITPEEALEHVGAVIDAGFDAVEIPLNSPQWEKSISAVVEAYGERALIGAAPYLSLNVWTGLPKWAAGLSLRPIFSQR